MSVLDLRWFFNERKNFVTFSMLLKHLPTKFYESKFVECMLSQFWAEAQRKIIWW